MLRSTLITGATGLLGSELVSQLLAHGETSRLVCLVRDSVPSSRFFTEELYKKCIVVHGDVRDEGLLCRIVSEYDINTIFHLAAQPLVETASGHPAETLDVNIRGTWTVLEAMRRFPKKVSATIVASSDKAYGHLSRASYEEGDALAGRYPYDVSKSCADLLAQSYAASFGLNIAITRCGNFFGPGDLNESRLVPSTVLALLRNQRPQLRSDGKYYRDYIYVADAAAAYRTLAARMVHTPLPGEAFNFSYGLRLSVLEVVEKIRALVGSSLQPEILDTARCEIKEQRLDSRKAREVLGWKPLHGLDDGLALTIQWYRKHLFGATPLKVAASG